jgi:SAM-dependent methyltransferase
VASLHVQPGTAGTGAPRRRTRRSFVSGSARRCVPTGRLSALTAGVVRASRYGCHGDASREPSASKPPRLAGRRAAADSARSVGARGQESDSLPGLPSASRIAHTGLPFANPMSEAAVDAALAALPLPARPRILDTGCGSGEMLLRALRLHHGARGLGVDLDADAIADARQRAGDLPAEFEVRDAATVAGAFDAVINVGSSHVHGGFPAALETLRGVAPVVLYGEGFWRRPPSEAFLAALGAREVEQRRSKPGRLAMSPES